MIMLIYPAGQEVEYLVCVFIYIQSLCIRASKAQASLLIWADSPVPSLLEDAMSNKISCADSLM